MGKKKGGTGGGGLKIDPSVAQSAIDAATPEPEAPAMPAAPSDSVEMYDATGQAVDVPQAQARQAEASGQYGFAKGQKVYLRDQGGRVLEVDGSEAGNALRQGYGLASKAETGEALEAREFGGFSKGAQAVGAGVGRGLTFGLSDLAAQQIGGADTAAYLSKLKKHHEIGSTVGEIGGAIAPVLLTGGGGAAVEGAELAGHGARAGLAARTIGAAGILPRAVAKVGGLAGEAAERLVGTGAESLLGRVAQKAIPLAASGAAEGGFLGAGQEISESALGNHELNAEKLLAAAASGAKIGALGGAVLGAGEVAATSAVNKVLELKGEQGLTDWLESFATNRRIKSLGASQRDIHRLGRTGEEALDRMKSISNTIRDYRFADGEKLFKGSATTEELAQSTRRALDEQTNRLDAVREKVAGIIESDPALRPDVNGFLARIKTDVLADLKASNVTSIRNRATKVEDELAGLEARAAPPALPADHPLAQVLESANAGDVNAKKMIDAAAVHDPAVAEAVNKPPVTIEELTQTRKDLDRIIYPKTNSGVPPPAPEHQAELLKVRGMLEETIVNATEAAAKQSGDPGLLATLLDSKKKIHDLIPANQMAERYVTRDIGNRAISPTDYFAGMSGVLHAATHGASAIGSLGMGGLASAAHHFFRERGSSYLAAAADKLAQISAVRRATLAVDRKIENGIDTFLSKRGAPSRIPAATAYLANRGQSRERVYEDKRADVQRMVMNPAAHMERAAQLVAPFAAHAPMTAAAVTDKAMTASQNLAAKLPQTPARPGSLTPTLDKRRVPPAEKAKFARYAAAVENPLSVLDDMRAGRLSREGVQALKDNSPELLNHIKTTIMEKISSGEKKLSYEKRIQLGVLFGVPTDPSLEPDFIASIQGMYAEAAQGQQQGGAPKGAKRPMDIASQSMTPTQDLMSASG